MAISFDKDDKSFYLIAKLAQEADCCIIDNETKEVAIIESTWDIDNGLVITDMDGQKYRLRVAAYPLIDNTE